MPRMLQIPLLSALVSALAMPSLIAANASEPYSIARFGNMLLVTAPADGGSSPALMAALNQRITVDFKDATVDEVANFVRSTTHLNLVLTPTAATRSMTLKATDMSLGTVLGWTATLTGLHLGYMHGAVFLSDTPISGDSVTRAYDVSSLVSPVRDFPGPELALDSSSGGHGTICFPPPVDAGDNKTPSTDEVIDLITNTIKPGQWNK